MAQDAIERPATVIVHPRLLLVDDHEPNLIALHEVLRGDEVELLSAKSGVEALEILLKCDVALAIIDVQMPDMDGFELAELMRGVDRARHVPIIFVTAGTHGGGRRFRGYEAGAVDFLNKPLEPTVLKSKVNVFLALDRQRRDLARLLEERTQAERQARASEARLQYALRATNDAVWDWDVLHDTQIWSQASIDLFGWPEIVETPQNSAWWLERVHPEDRQRVANDLYAVVEHPMTLHWEDEYRFLKKDGSYAQVLDRGHVVRDAKGKAVRMIGAMQDITARKQAEARVKKSEQHFRKVTESLPQLVWTCRPDGACDYLSPQWIIYTGVPEAPQLGYGWLEQIHPEDRERVITAWKSIAPQGDNFSIEFRIRRRDDVYRWFHTQAVALRDESGAIVKWFGANTDMHNIKESEAALRESEERLAGVVATAMDAILSVDSRQRITLFNRAAEELFGCPAEAALGQPLDRFIPDRYLTTHKTHIEGFGGTGATTRRMGRYGMVFGLRTDGSEFPIEASISQLDVRGDKLYTVILRDVSERIKAETALRESEQRLRHHIGNAGLAVIEWDANWILTRWEGEAERIFGWTLEEVLGKPLSDLHIVYNEDIPVVQDALVQLNDGLTHTLVSHYRNYTKNGRVIHCAWHNSVLLDGNGHPSSVLSLIQDETAKVEVEAALQSLANRLEKTVEDRTRELSESQAQLRALAKELNLSEQRERARLARELHDYLQQTLVLGKLTIGHGKRAVAGVPACEQVLKKVDDLFSEALTYTRTLVSDLSPPVLRDHGLAASFQWLATYMLKHEQTVIVTVPENRELELPEDQVMLLFQSVRELLINSAKHAGTGQATITMKQGEGQLSITVSDEGKGFELAVAGGSTQAGGISSKFGLFSIRERMRALGGSFEIESAPEQGTTATLVLPLAPRREVELNIKTVDPQPRLSSTLAATLESTSSRIRVLLVDDHVMVRQGLRAVLEAYADVELIGEAGNGEEAVQLVDRLRPTVVVMDINMPKMDGIEATRTIKLRYPEIIVVGISVNAARENEEAMKQAGAIRLMTKEAAMEELYEAIQEAVTKRVSRTEPYSW